MQTAPPSPSVKGPAPCLVVSIHDLSTVTREMVVRMLEDLEGVGVPVTSLLVIPDHHHKGRIDADPKFVEMLQVAVARGHEAVLHGYYHLRPSKEEEGVATKVITRSEEAVREEGFAYTTRIGAVIDCRDGFHFNSRSMVYSVRSPWRRGVSLLWNEALFHVLRNTPLLRIGLHPPDWEHEAIRRHALACIRKAAAERQVTTYGKWLDLARASRHEGGEN